MTEPADPPEPPRARLPLAPPSPERTATSGDPGEDASDALSPRPGAPLATALAALTRPGALATTRDDGLLTCLACAHRCVMAEGRAGACGVRFQANGEVRVPYGYVARKYVRSVETNTIYHVLPGAKALTFGMYGCDLRCPYCHNHNVSQALRDGATGETPTTITAEELVDEALREGCRVICAAYNEPMITAEWVHDVFAVAKARGLTTAVVSDGNTTEEALTFLRPVTDVFRVDLKGFTNEQYKKLGGRLEPVLAGVRKAKELGFWVEVVTLVVPGFNDDLRGLRAIAQALVAIDPAMPWHLDAFQPRYRMADKSAMGAPLLVQAAGMAYARGLRFVYVGNVDDETTELSHTRCPKCHDVLVRRRDWSTLESRLAAGACGSCGTPVPGLLDREGALAARETAALQSARV